MSWFESDLKKQYQKAKEAARDRQKLQEEELKNLEDEYNRRLKTIEENIRETNYRREQFTAKNEATTEALERKIEQMEKCYFDELAATERNYEQRLKERSSASNAELRRIKENFDSEKKALVDKHDKEVQEKKKEILDMTTSYQQEILAIDEENRDILRKRDQELSNHVARKIELQQAYNDKIDELDGIVQTLKKKNLECLRDRIKNETKRKNDLRANLLTTQKTKMLTQWERNLVDVAHEIANRLESALEHTQTISEFCIDISTSNQEPDTEVAMLRSIMYDWNDSRDGVKNQITRFRQRQNNYSAIPIEVRDELLVKVNNVSTGLDAIDTDRISLDTATLNGKYDRIATIGLALQLKLEHMNNVKQILIDTRASYDQTPSMLESRELNTVARAQEPSNATHQQGSPSTSASQTDSRVQVSSIELPILLLEEMSLGSAPPNNEIHEEPPYIPDEED